MAGRIRRKLVDVVLLGFLVIPVLFLTLLKPQIMGSLSVLNLQVSVGTNIQIKVMQDNNTSTADISDDVLLQVHDTSPPVEEMNQRNSIVTPTENTPERPASTAVDEDKDTHNSADNSAIPVSSMISCDFSQRRTDICILRGDVRVVGASSSIIFVNKSQSPQDEEPRKIWNIRPYARKWETPVMELIRQVSIKQVSSQSSETPECSIHHGDIPAIVFSTGGFLGKNFFHDFSDVLVPLFITSYQYHGRVQFLVTNFNYRWFNKYEVILKRLSNYEIINLDRDNRVHCFKNTAHVGLMSHSELVIDPDKTPGNYTMADFRELLRSSLSLRRKSVRTNGDGRPRLLLMLRKGSRLLTNRKEVVSLARRVGFKVVVTGPEKTKDLARFAGIVNSCDVMVGVHGAGLTNMIFLPVNATLIQIIPWGGLRYASNHDYGDPTGAMGIRYLEYEVREEESSLVNQYPRDHPVFTDPVSIHRQGWNALWSVFLNRQDIKVDAKRFRAVLQEAMRYLPR